MRHSSRFQRAAPWLGGLVLAWSLTALVACQPESLITPPRVATQTAAPQPGPTALPVATGTLAPVPTQDQTAAFAAADLASAALEPRITVWIDQTSPAHRSLLERLVDQFQEDQPVQVEVLHVATELMPKLMETAVLSGTVPDLVLHPIDYTMAWLADGILDPTAAQSALDQLGPETFDQAALTLLRSAQADGPVAALPSDGWKQLLVYRGDWFDERGLPPPLDYTTIISGAAGIARPDDLISGLVVPTEDNLISTQRVFEQYAVANGCELVSPSGEITLLHPNCLDALEYYRGLVNGYSPSDIQTDTSALNAYLEGRTGLIVGSPALLPVLAGLDPQNQPRCPECGDPGFLARQSRIVSAIRGRSTDATDSRFAQLSVLGITTAADVPAATAFAVFWFDAAYLDWLSLDPIQKAPLRTGTAGSPSRFLDAWLGLPLVDGGPTAAELFGPMAVTDLATDLGETNRWGFAEGQGAVVSAVVKERVLSILLQEMLSGYQTTSRTLLDAYDRTVALIPGYAYDEGD